MWCVTPYELVVVELPQGGLEWSCCKVTAERKLRSLNWFSLPRRCRSRGASKLKDDFTSVVFGWQCGHVLDVLHCTSTPIKAGGMRPNSLVRLLALVVVR